MGMPSLCVCVYFPEVSEMVMPLTPMQGRLNSWYWLCEHLPLRIQTIQFYFNWGLQTEREEVPRLHVAHTQTHTHKHTAAHTLRLRVECVILQWYRLNRILTPLCWSHTETNALNITKAACVYMRVHTLCLYVCTFLLLFQMCSSLNIHYTWEYKCATCVNVNQNKTIIYIIAPWNSLCP